ncbi:hypothetical protein JKF63_04681 [Porcisia hertigi]|uniref:Uncharacterized protein n=1 Tax=Porcisia hertigi TaxID=2761500 RepID=A0A836IKM4_9TRYP|nr:hypothetical protein JKF63_04681 [Porcisia hertigi]
MRFSPPLGHAVLALHKTSRTKQSMRIFTAAATLTCSRLSGSGVSTCSLSLLPLLHQRRAVGQSSTPPEEPPASLLPRSSNSSSTSTVGSQRPVTNADTASGRSATSESRPSLEPVIVELRTLITHTVPVGKVFRALSPASQKILVAHRLPLEELLLHLPNHFLLYRVGGKASGNSATLHVAPPSCANSNMQLLRLPPGTKPLPALEQWLGPQKAKEVATPYPDRAGGPPRTGAGTGFVDTTTTLKERLEEVLTYIPNEWTPFTSLQIPRDVKMRCMGYPHVRPNAFMLRYPQFFEIRVQSRDDHSFLVRRALSLQQQLDRARKP